MDLLIKNVDYPVEPSENKIFYPCTMCIQPNGSIYITINDEVGAVFEVVKLPSPHGRLIDADVACEKYKDEDSFIAELAYRKIRNAPTVIEAEAE